MIDQPITIRPEELWTQEEIEGWVHDEINNADWIPECHWLVRDEQGNLIPHPPRI